MRVYSAIVLIKYHSFNLFLNEPSVCKENQTNVLVMIESSYTVKT